MYSNVYINHPRPWITVTQAPTSQLVRSSQVTWPVTWSRDSCTGLWLVNTGHVTQVLASDWSRPWLPSTTTSVAGGAPRVNNRLFAWKRAHGHKVHIRRSPICKKESTYKHWHIHIFKSTVQFLDNGLLLNLCSNIDVKRRISQSTISITLTFTNFSTMR